jgi:pimeloyl-ACP methyl ester carboxylesterase
MPKVKVNGAWIHYETQGDGPETIVFAHGLLWSGSMFDNQMAALKSHYRCIAFDFRGQGQSTVTPSGYGLESLYLDTVALIEKLNAAPCHFVGVSMGGMIGLRIALHQPALLKSLALFATSADAEDQENRRRYRTLTLIAGLLGIRVVADKAMPVMFGKTFLNDPLRAGLKAHWRDQLIANRRIGLALAVMGVIHRAPIYDQIHKIILPTMVALGEEDLAIPREKARRIHSQISGSKFALIPRAGHTPTVEEPALVNALLEQFISNAAA